MMMLKFEVQKFISHSKNIFLIGLILVSTIGYFFYLNAQQKSYLKEEEKAETALLTRLQLIAYADNQEKQQNDPTLKLAKQLVELKLLENSQKEWRQKLSLENKFLTVLANYQKAGGEVFLDPVEIKQKKAENKFLIQQGVQPVLLRKSTKGFYFIAHLAESLVSFLGLLVFILFFSDSLVSEYQKQTIRFLYVQPIQYLRILWSKFLVIVLLFSGIAMGVLLLTGGLGGLLNGFGSLDYPLLVQQGTQFSWISLGEYLLKLVSLYFTFILFSGSLLILISTILKDSFEVFLTLILSLGLGAFILNTVEAFRTVSGFLPIAYLDIPMILRRSESSLLAPSYWLGLITLTVSSGFIWLLLVFRNREVRN